MKTWQHIKEKALKALEQAIENKEVDEEVLPILNVINATEQFVTTSSCAGRITIFRRKPKKEDSAFLFKWHRRITEEELRTALLSLKRIEDVELRAESFILHVLAKDVDSASRLLQVARQSGIKKGGIQQIGEKILVELRGNVCLTVPLQYFYPTSFSDVVNLLNAYIEENENARQRFLQTFKNSF